MNNQIKEEGLTDAYLLGKYDGIKQGRADAIDEVIYILKHRNTTILENGYEYHGYDDEELEEVAEQLKKEQNT